MLTIIDPSHYLPSADAIEPWEYKLAAEAIRAVLDVREILPAHQTPRAAAQEAAEVAKLERLMAKLERLS